MKRFLYLLAVMVSAQGLLYAQQLKEGDYLAVKRVRDGAITGISGELISPNTEYVKADGKNHAAYGIVHVSGDTLRVQYFDKKTDRLQKEETYDAQAYFASNGDLLMNGKQTYYHKDGWVLCEEQFRAGIIRRTTWYNRHGQKDRMYIYGKNGISRSAIGIMSGLQREVQFYPSGKVKWQQTYTEVNALERKTLYEAFAEDGSKADTWSAPVCPDTYAAFEDYFTHHFQTPHAFNGAIVFGASLVIDTAGRCRATLYEEKLHKTYQWKDDNAPRWTPAVINGRKVPLRVSRMLRYAPFVFAHDNDTLAVAFSYHTTKTNYGLPWRHDYHWTYHSASDTCAQYVVLHWQDDTLTLTGYNREPHELIFTRQMAHIDNGQLVNNGLYNIYQDGRKTYAELYKDGKLIETRFFYPDGALRATYAASPDRERFTRATDYYPTGEVMKQTTISDEKDPKPVVAYFNRQGKPAQAKEPAYPGGALALQTYITMHLNLEKTPAWKYAWQSMEGYLDCMVEVDENGKATYLNFGAWHMDWSFFGDSTLFTKKQKQECMRLIFDCLKEDTTPWKPATIDKQPVAMTTRVRVKYHFNRDYSRGKKQTHKSQWPQRR